MNVFLCLFPAKALSFRVRPAVPLIRSFYGFQAAYAAQSDFSDHDFPFSYISGPETFGLPAGLYFHSIVAWEKGKSYGLPV